MKARRLWMILLVLLAAAGVAGFRAYVHADRLRPVQQAPVPQPAAITQPAAVSNSSGARILMFHYVRAVDPKSDPLGYRLSVTETQLEAVLTALEKSGYASATMADYAAGRTNARSAVLTFDDGYADFFTAAAPILKRRGWSATLYVVSQKIGGDYMTWDQIRELKAEGFEIGAHTRHHYDLASMVVSRQLEEIAGSKADIEAQIGAPVVSFCYPSGKYTADTERIVRSAGFLSATTTHPGVTPVLGADAYALPRLRVSPDTTPASLTR